MYQISSQKLSQRADQAYGRPAYIQTTDSNVCDSCWIHETVALQMNTVHQQASDACNHHSNRIEKATQDRSIARRHKPVVHPIPLEWTFFLEGLAVCPLSSTSSSSKVHHTYAILIVFVSVNLMSLVTSCDRLLEEKPQIAFPLSFTWVSHIAASVVTGC